MNRLLKAGCLGLLVFLGVARAGPCVQANLAFYTASGFGCNIGTFTFASLAYTDLGTGVPTSAITVTPIADQHGTGLELIFNNVSTNFNTRDAELQYLVTSTTPFSTMYMEISGIFGNGATGGITEVYCPGGTTLPPDQNCPGSNGQAQTAWVTANAAHPDASGSVTFAATQKFATLKDIDLQSGLGVQNAGNATAGFAKNQFGPPVPEPGTLLTLSSGLLVLLGGKKLLKRRP